MNIMSHQIFVGDPATDKKTMWKSSAAIIPPI